MDNPLLNVSIGLIFWSAVTFIIVLLVLRKYLWNPLVDNLDNREKTIHEALRKADEARDGAEKTLAEYNAQLGEARTEVRQIIAKGKDSAEKIKADILDEASRRADALLVQAKNEIDAEKKKALDEVRAIAADVSVAAAEMMLKRNLTDDDHMKLIDEALRNVEKGS